jgi:hypothetical protein
MMCFSFDVDFRNGLATLSLVRDPFPDIGWAAPEFDPFGFGPEQKLHRIRADQLYLGKFDGNEPASIERHSNEFQIFRCQPTADGQDQTLFSRDSIDSVWHWLAFACCLQSPLANGTPSECY